MKILLVKTLDNAYYYAAIQDYLGAFLEHTHDLSPRGVEIMSMFRGGPRPLN